MKRLRVRGFPTIGFLISSCGDKEWMVATVFRRPPLLQTLTAAVLALDGLTRISPDIAASVAQNPSLTHILKYACKQLSTDGLAACSRLMANMMTSSASAVAMQSSGVLRALLQARSYHRLVSGVLAGVLVGVLGVGVLVWCGCSRL